MRPPRPMDRIRAAYYCLRGLPVIYNLDGVNITLGDAAVCANWGLRVVSGRYSHFYLPTGTTFQIDDGPQRRVGEDAQDEL